MELNKNYYFSVNSGVIVSGECDRIALSDVDLNAFKSTIQPLLDNDTLFTGKDLKTKTVTAYNVRTKKVVESVIVTNFTNIEFADGKITVAELHSGKNQLRVWYRSEDYEKKASDKPADDTETNGTTDQPDF